VFAGLIGIIDPPPTEAKDAVARAKGAGIHPLMITGDHPRTAAVIAQELGITEDGRAITGAELEKLPVDRRRGGGEPRDFPNIRKFLRYLLSSNIGEVLTMFFGVVCRARTGTTICWPPRVGRSRKRGARPDRDLLSGGRRQPQQIASFQPVGRELFTHELAASFCEREPSCRISGRERKEAAGTWQQTESCGAGTARDVRNDPRSPRYVNCSFIRTCGSSQGSAHFGSTANVCESARGRRARSPRCRDR